MGFGSAALQQLMDFFEGKGLALQEPPGFAAFAQRRAKHQQKDKGKVKQKVSKLDGDIEDLDAEAGLSDEEEGEGEADGMDKDGNETETETEDTETEAGQADTEESGPGSSETRANKKGKKSLEGKMPKSTEALGAAAVSLLEVKAEELQPRSTPPLLCPCSRSRPPFTVDYLGTSFGLTEQLFRFWSRKGFTAVYLRQQPSDVTGEHSCIMLRPASAAGPTLADSGDSDTRRRGLYGGIDVESEGVRRPRCMNRFLIHASHRVNASDASVGLKMQVLYRVFVSDSGS